MIHLNYKKKTFVYRIWKNKKWIVSFIWKYLVCKFFYRISFFRLLFHFNDAVNAAWKIFPPKQMFLHRQPNMINIGFPLKEKGTSTKLSLSFLFKSATTKPDNMLLIFIYLIIQKKKKNCWINEAADSILLFTCAYAIHIKMRFRCSFMLE